MLAERLHITMDDSFALLRTYARSHNLRLYEVSLAVASGEIVATDLADAMRQRSD